MHTLPEIGLISTDHNPVETQRNDEKVRQHLQRRQPDPRKRAALQFEAVHHLAPVEHAPHGVGDGELAVTAVGAREVIQVDAPDHGAAQTPTVDPVRLQETQVVQDCVLGDVQHWKSNISISGGLWLLGLTPETATQSEPFA